MAALNGTVPDAFCYRFARAIESEGGAGVRKGEGGRGREVERERKEKSTAAQTSPWTNK